MSHKATNNQKNADDDYRMQDILVSIRSSDQEDNMKQYTTNVKNKNIQPKQDRNQLQPQRNNKGGSKNSNYNRKSFDSDEEFEIRETINFDHLHQKYHVNDIQPPRADQIYPVINNFGNQIDDQNIWKNSDKPLKRPISSQSSDRDNVKDFDKNKITSGKIRNSMIVNSSSDSDGSDWKDTNEIVTKNKVKIQKSSKEVMFDSDTSSEQETKINSNQFKKQPRKTNITPTKLEPVENNNDDDEMINIGKSIFTSKPITILSNNKPKNQKSSEPSTIIPHLNMNQFHEADYSNINQSVYMASGVEINLVGNHIFWKFENQQVQINKKAIDTIFQEFLQNGIMLPLFSEEQFQIGLTVIYKILSRFTALMNNTYYYEFKQVLSGIFNNKKQRKSSVDESQQNSDSAKGFNLKNIYSYIDLKFLSQNSYSKIQITRNYFLHKLITLRKYEEALNNLTKTSKNSQIQQNSNSSFVKQIDSLEQQIADLEFLVSFENAEKYCKMKSDKLQQKIWKERARKNYQLKKTWINLRTKQASQQNHCNNKKRKQILFRV